MNRSPDPSDLRHASARGRLCTYPPRCLSAGRPICCAAYLLRPPYLLQLRGGGERSPPRGASTAASGAPRN